MRKVSFESEEERVDGTLFIPDVKIKSAGVIFFHGSGSSEKNYIGMGEQLLRRGVAALTLNLRGHGTSEGKFKDITPEANIKDALAAYDFFIKQEGVDPERIGVCGSSYGAVLASLLSEKRALKSLVLRVPAAYTEKMMKIKLEEVLADEERVFKIMGNIGATPAVSAISKFKGSLLIVPSENDNLIPIDIPKAFLESAKVVKRKEMRIMDGAGHVLSDEQRKKYTEIMASLFTETL